MRAAVQPQPRYRPKPSSRTILRTPRPRNASGLVWRLILSTSRGRRTISPIPIRLEEANVMSGDCSHVKRGRLVSLCVPSGGGVHDGLAGLLAKSLLKILSVVRCQVVPGHGLATILVYPLQNLTCASSLLATLLCGDKFRSRGRWGWSNLVSGGVAQTGEQREKLLSNRGGGLVLEDDRVQLRESGHLSYDTWSVIGSRKTCTRGAIERRTLDSLLIRRFAIVSTCFAASSVQALTATGGLFGSRRGPIRLFVPGGRQPAPRYRPSLRSC